MQNVRPVLIAIELNDEQPGDALDRAPRPRDNAPPRSIPIPVIVYGNGLSTAEIERAANGAMWLEHKHADGKKLVAAIRGVLAAARIAIKGT